MARVSYVENVDDPDYSGLVDNIRSGRGGSLINVYKLLLHSPPLAESWYNHLNTVRWGTMLDGRLREIVVIRIAYVNNLEYVINQHVPKMAEAEGLSVDECDALQDWPKCKSFSAAEHAVLALCDSMTRDVTVSNEVFEDVRSHFDERRIVELVVLIGAYNMHTRVMKALDIDLEIS